MEFETVGRSHWEGNWSIRPNSRRLSGANVFNSDFLALVGSVLKSVAAPVVVEIGCAPGKMLYELEVRFRASCVGYDYSERGCELAKSFLASKGGKARIVMRDVLNSPPEAEEADLAYSIGVVEHFSDPWGMVRAHLHPLKMGGKALIVLPNYSGLGARIQRRLDPENLAIHNLELMSLSYWSRFIAERGLTGRCFEFGRPSPWMFSLSRLGVLGRGVQIAWNFLSFAIPRRLSPLRAMLVIELTK